MTTTIKNAPDTSGNSVEGNAHNIPAGDLMNKQKLTVITVDTTTDIDWSNIKKDTLIVAACHEEGCSENGQVHTLYWGDQICHTALKIREEDIRVDVQKLVGSDYSEFEEHNRWVASGVLSDDDSSLTIARLERFTDLFRFANNLANSLNKAAS